MASYVKNNLVLTFFLALLWANFVSLSKGVDTNSNNGIAAKGTSISPTYVASMPCLKILIPCQIYLKPSTKTPSPSCCVSIKEVLSNDGECLCDIFNSADVLVSLNVTQDDALKLPKACGESVNVSVCKRDAKFSSPSTPGNPSATSGTSSSSNSASVISHIAGTSFSTGFFSLIITIIYNFSWTK